MITVENEDYKNMQLIPDVLYRLSTISVFGGMRICFKFMEGILCNLTDDNTEMELEWYGLINQWHFFIEIHTEF